MLGLSNGPQSLEIAITHPLPSVFHACILHSAQKMYSQYAQGFEGVNTLVADMTQRSSALRQFLEECSKDPRVGGQTLPSFLIMPIQRVPRYSMLLSETLKRTTEDHADHGPLERALALIKEAATFNNEMIRARENREKIQEVEARWSGLRGTMVRPGRWFVREGTLIKACRRADKPFECRWRTA